VHGLSGLKISKLLGLILGLSILNVVVLSPGLLGVTIGGSALETAFGVTLLVISLVVVLYGSYSLLLKAPLATPTKQIKTHEDYLEALAFYRPIKVLESDITLAMEQLTRLKKKVETLVKVLGERFDPSELSYKKFHSVVFEVEKLFYLNIRGVLNRLDVFDEAEFAALTSRKAKSFSPTLLREKTEVYQDYLAYVKSVVEGNEEILLKLDKLLLEISRLDSVDVDEIENMSAMQEIDSLIHQTKYYRQ
jgi:hypothetical protein